MLAVTRSSKMATATIATFLMFALRVSGQPTAPPTGCPQVQEPQHGEANCVHNGTEFSCTISCDPGFILTTGAHTFLIFCEDAVGVWSHNDTQLKCMAFSGTTPSVDHGNGCNALPAPTNGVVQCSHNGSLLICTAICSSGFVFDTGVSYVQHMCDDSGRWLNGNSFPNCIGNCDVDVVKPLTDGQFNASSVWSGVNGYYFGPERSRIDAIAEGNSSMVYSGGWRPAVDELDQYVQVDLLYVTRITGIVTKGRDVITGDTANEYVTRFRVLHSMDGIHWEPYSSRTVTDVFFIGNSNNSSPTTSRLSCPFNARYVRINPISWHEHIALRFALLGCRSDGSKPPCESAAIMTAATTTTPVYTTTTKATAHAHTTPRITTSTIKATMTTPSPAAMCYNIPPLVNGQLNCEQQFGLPDKLVCVGHCKQGYIFETNEMVVQKICNVTTGIWPSGKTFPSCIATITTPSPAGMCYNIPPLVNGQLNCEQQFGLPDKLVCVGHCKQGYIFETNEMAVKKVCNVTTGIWPSGKTFPACIENHHSTPLPLVHNYTHGCVTTEHDCDTIGNGDFQACGGCHFFATCSEGFMFIRACPEHLLYDTATQTCEYRSKTCYINTQPVG